MSYFYGIDEPRLPWPFAYQGQPARFEEIRRPRGREIDLAIASHAILQEAGLHAQLHSYGTNVEGDLDQIFAAVRRIHETLHAEGTVRLSTFLKIGTRTDKDPDLAAKLF